MIIGEQLFDPAWGVPTGTLKAELADEYVTTYDTYDVIRKWFGEDVQVQILIDPGQLCLLGTNLLYSHRLEIDYGQPAVRFVRNSQW